MKEQRINKEHSGKYTEESKSHTKKNVVDGEMSPNQNHVKSLKTSFIGLSIFQLVIEIRVKNQESNTDLI